MGALAVANGRREISLWESRFNIMPLQFSGSGCTLRQKNNAKAKPASDCAEAPVANRKRLAKITALIAPPFLLPRSLVTSTLTPFLATRPRYVSWQSSGYSSEWSPAACGVGPLSCPCRCASVSPPRSSSPAFRKNLQKKSVTASSIMSLG